MAKNKDSIQYVFTVAFAVCMVCAIVVATSAVVLRPLQVENKELDLKRNILAAAGLMEDGKTVKELFASIETRLVDISEGQFSTDFDVDTFDSVKAVSDPALTDALDKVTDIADIKRREKYAEVYLVRGTNGDIETVVLPIRGYGLWSTLWGFIALESDFKFFSAIGWCCAHTHFIEALNPGSTGVSNGLSACEIEQ